MFSFLKKSAVSKSEAAYESDFGMLCTEKQKKLVDCTHKLDVILEKKNLHQTTARVVFVLDHSGSMRPLYQDGTVQNTLERIFPVALRFDDNGEMQFYLFDTVYQELDPVSLENLEGYTENIIMKKMGKYGQTRYAPAMNTILHRYAEKEPSNIPTFVIFITDGDNSDKSAAKQALIAASKHNIFWKFIGIGKESFPFLEKLDDLGGRYVDNANYISIPDLNAMKNEALYERLMEEYDDWRKAAKRAGIPIQ
ncbi:MAG: VWA domain-containing protein [Butyricicoccus pullicaecorum]|nr:VWA domain-containing protein [Butyricicoccus pullicaecorum]